jgi:hypothetical protein
MESAHPIFYSTASVGVQHPLSPPQNTQTYHHISPFPIASRSTPVHQQEQYQDSLNIQPSYSTPIIGTKQLADLHHKSWPDVFFSGRDLFDTLPSRRASVNTQYVFELHPNSTTTTAASSSASSPTLYGHNSPYNHHQSQAENKSTAGVHSEYTINLLFILYNV